LKLARRLQYLLSVLAAKAPANEHFDLRLAEALAGNIADKLEALL
jgi:hypothetical protein